MIFHFVLILTTRSMDRGWAGAYDVFWACNMSLPVCGIGLLMRLPSLVGCTLIFLCFEHSMFCIDAFVYMIAGFWPTGAAAFLMWPQTPKMEWVTTSHHVWFIPCCLAALYKSGGVQMHMWYLSIVFSIGLFLIGRFFVPYELKNPSQPDAAYYLNLNFGYEIMKDVPIAFLHVFDNSPFAIYMGWIIFLGNVLFNGPFLIALRLLSVAVME